MSKKIMFLLISMLICFFANTSFAKEAQPMIYKHVQTDGTTILFSQDIRRIGIKGDILSIELHKTFKPDGKNYNAIRIMTNGIIASKHDIVSANLIIDGANYELAPLSGARRDDLPADVEQMWYEFPDELADKIRNVQKLSITVNMNNGQKQEKEIGGTALQTMKLLASSNDAAAFQEYARSYGHPVSFRMFFPGAKPEEIGTGLVHEANYTNGKFNNYLNYYQVNFRNDWTKLSLEYIKSFYDVKRSAPFILVEMKEENNGTLVKLDVLGKSYIYGSRTAFGMTTTYLQDIEYYPLDPKDKLTNGELFELDSWTSHLMSLYQELHGSYDYGLDWEIANTEKGVWKRMRKDWSAGPYDIKKINKDQFKELSDISIGDKIIAINGKPADMIYYPKSIIETKYAGAPVVFTIRQQDGVEKNVKITPQFIPSAKPKTSYLELLKKNSGQLTNNSVMSGDADTVFTTYDPLGKRDF